MGSAQSVASAGSVGGSNVGLHQRQATQDLSHQSSQRQTPTISQQSPLHSLSQQQWQQALAAAAALQSNGVTPSLAQNLLLSGLSSSGLGEQAYSAMQQFAFQQYVQAQAQAQAKLSAAQQAALAQSLSAYSDPGHQALLMALSTGKVQQLQQTRGFESGTPSHPQQLVIPAAATTSATTGSTTSNEPTVSSAPVPSPALTSMKPPPPQSTQGDVRALSSSATTPNQRKAHQSIAPMPVNQVHSDSDTLGNLSSDDRKQQKRAANRKSAQLSRKRKKQFIEELKDENDELRRKEQILRSIPDLVVVFDSSGKLSFVSQSVSLFLDIPAEKLEGTSFWDRMCNDSVRLLKAAFMDSLAARKPDSETAPLGSGVWELRLVDKESKYLVVTLNGVVHFTGDAPECICCIRPRDQKPIQELPKERKNKSHKPHGRLVSSSDGSRTSDGSTVSDDQHPRIRVNPSQSVISNDILTEDISADNSAEDDSSPQGDSLIRMKVRRTVKMKDEHVANGRSIRISDGDGGESGGEVSESSASDDGIASS